MRSPATDTDRLEAAPVEATSRDRAVYGAAVTALFSGENIPHDTLGLIDRTTSPDKQCARIPEVAAQLRAARASALPSLRTETAADFDSKAFAPALLQSPVQTRIPHRLVVAGTEDARSWLDDRTIPVRTRVAVSRVGYATDGTQALVYVELHCPLCGWGQLVLLEFRHGVWTVLATMRAWNS